MKLYDFQKVKDFIENHKKTIFEVSLGIHEDWFWTADEVWKNGEYLVELTDDTKIGGINGSTWGTPVMQVCYFDRTEEMIEISKGENTKEGPPFPITGCLSKPVQDNIQQITRKK